MAGISLSFRRSACRPSRLPLGRTGAYAEHVFLPEGEAYEFALTGHAHYMALHDIVLRDGEMSVAGAPPVRTKDLRRTLTFLPAGLTTKGWCDPEARPQAFTAIYFAPDAVGDELRTFAWWHKPEIYFRSTELENVLLRLRRALTRSEPFAPLLGETLSQLALAEFAQRTVLRQRPPRPVGALSEQQVRTVQAIMEEHLNAEVTLDDLASSVGLSKYHFLRAYKAATGRTPYRDLLERRVARAKVLLEGGSSLKEVAARTGFASAAELSRAFKRSTGCLPGKAGGARR